MLQFEIVSTQRTMLKKIVKMLRLIKKSAYVIYEWSQRQTSQTGTGSMRSGSAASVEGGGNSHHAQAILSKGPSESTLTTTESAGGGNSSQTPSCRALAGSLASFDTSSIVNTEGN